jgi:hypothetical protein
MTGFTIFQDADVERPDWMLGTLAIRQIGDEEPTTPPHNSIVLPVYRYEHSCTQLNTTGFYCPWDSAKTGYIYVDAQKIRDEFKWKRITATRRSKIEQHLRDEVQTWSEYFNGEVYRYVLDTGESCGGFFGYENCKEEAQNAAADNLQ